MTKKEADRMFLDLKDAHEGVGGPASRKPFGHWLKDTAADDGHPLQDAARQYIATFHTSTDGTKHWSDTNPGDGEVADIGAVLKAIAPHLEGKDPGKPWESPALSRLSWLQSEVDQFRTLLFGRVVTPEAWLLEYERHAVRLVAFLTDQPIDEEYR